MKRSVCLQLMFVFLFVLQSQQLHSTLQALEYSVEERIYIVKSLVSEHALPHSEDPNLQRHSNNNYEEQQKSKHQQHLHTQSPPPNYNQYQPQPQSQQQPQSPPPQQQLQNHQHHQQTIQQQQQPHQKQNQLQYDEQHHLPESSLQQVPSNTPVQQYHYARTQIEWKHETTFQGELNEFYLDNYESSFPVITQDQLAYYQYHHHLQQQYHHQSHLIYSGQTNDGYDYSINKIPSDSCVSQNPSILMQSNSEEPTCRATNQAARSINNPTSSDSTGNVPNFSQLTNKPSHNSNIESFPLAPPEYHYESSLKGAIRHYWREVLGLCLASAIFLNWLFSVIKRRFVFSGLTRSEQAMESNHQTATRSISKDTNSSSAHDSAFDEIVSPASLDDVDISRSSDHRDKSSNSVHVVNTTSVLRHRSSTLKAEPIPIPISPGHNSQSTSLSNSLNASDYNSRYSSDFDSIRRLGRGGFGIVFEAKNKIDDCHYAVKRICLPLENEARERVMREVRALAKLDHAGIVRYYNAWLETPPDEWLKKHDAQLGIVHSKDGASFPSTDGIYERNGSEHIIKSGKFGESGDNSSGLFGSSPFKRRTNGFRRLLKNNSSSPSLDIVFEGSGSIRLESKNNTEKTDSSDEYETRHKNLQECKNGDINSDSEDSDFIQFESRSNKMSANGIDNENDVSISSHLTEPFSSSDSEVEDNSLENCLEKKPFDVERKNALRYQKELRQLNNVSLVENLQVEKAYLYIQMQLCRKDTLKDWLKTNCENRDKTTIFDLFYQIVDAVEYVHSQDLIHRDLKPSNIFFSLDGTLKIGDFGLCRAKTSASGIGSSLDLQEYVAESVVERSFEAVHTEQVGTQLYMSPEQLNGLSYNQKVDIFAMGLILLELLIPFKTQMQRVNVLFKARNNVYSDEFRNDHPQEYELAKSLLSRSPQKRPTATEIKQHELLASAQLSQPVIERIYHRRRTISSNSSTE